jgi:hypothetical protein
MAPWRPGALPAGYRQAVYWRISAVRGRTVAVNLVAIAAFVAVYLALNHLAKAAFGRQAGDPFGLWGIPLTLGAVLFTVVLHEWVHAAAMRAFGARPVFGVLWRVPAAYATAPGFAFRRSHYVLVAVAPLVLLSLVALAAMALLAGSPWLGTLVMCAAMNAAGAVGDLWIVGLVLRYPPRTYCVDEMDGVRLWVPAETPAI